MLAADNGILLKSLAILLSGCETLDKLMKYKIQTPTAFWQPNSKSLNYFSDKYKMCPPLYNTIQCYSWYTASFDSVRLNQKTIFDSFTEEYLAFGIALQPNTLQIVQWIGHRYYLPCICHLLPQCLRRRARVPHSSLDFSHFIQISLQPGPKNV